MPKTRPTGVIATAGHVDHGKSTLIQALTGIDPDRWPEEHRRGCSLDLGFAWARLPSGRDVAFVDIPGHRRYLDNALAGLGPTTAVMLIVAADEGWQAQTFEHLDIISALGISHGLVVVTKSDRAPGDVTTVIAQSRYQLTDTPMHGAPIVGVSARTGGGLRELTEALGRILATPRASAADKPVRLWVDRAFSIRGAGTVVTGTLTAGQITRGDTLVVHHERHEQTVSVRSLQSDHTQIDEAAPITRIAVNLRGIDHSEVQRGDLLCTPHSVQPTQLVDVRVALTHSTAKLPPQLRGHVGTTALNVQARPLNSAYTRLTLERPVPLLIGDHVILRHPATGSVIGGAEIIDPAPRPLPRRRGAAQRHAAALQLLEEQATIAARINHHGGVVRRDRLTQWGIDMDGADAAGTADVGPWLVTSERLNLWATQVEAIVSERVVKAPLSQGVSMKDAAAALEVPDQRLMPAVVDAANVALVGSHLRSRTPPRLVEYERGLAQLEAQLEQAPFGAPSVAALQKYGLSSRALDAARGRLLVLRDYRGNPVALHHDAATLAVPILAKLCGPFSTASAREALATSRRAIVPLLEHLDLLGLTQRHPSDLRTVRDRP